MANLVLAFPVILLFYLLVTPEIVKTGIPTWFAAILFVFPIVFFVILFNSRFFTNPAKRNLYVGAVLVIGIWAYSGLAFNLDPLGIWSMDPNLLNVFVSVVFVNSPGVFRIVRGMVMDIKTRDYVAAGQTRGEGAWYIMLWEILPNALPPLIVSASLIVERGGPFLGAMIASLPTSAGTTACTTRGRARHRPGSSWRSPRQRQESIDVCIGDRRFLCEVQAFDGQGATEISLQEM